MVRKINPWILLPISLLILPLVFLVEDNLSSAHPIYNITSLDGEVIVCNVDSFFCSDSEEYRLIKLRSDVILPENIFAFTYSDDTSHLWHIVENDLLYKDNLQEIGISERIVPVQYFPEPGAIRPNPAFASCSSLKPWRIGTCEGETLVHIEDGIFFVPSAVRVLEEGFLSVLGANGQYKTIDP